MKLITVLLSVILLTPAFANTSLDMSFDCGGLIHLGDEAQEYTEFTISYDGFESSTGYKSERLISTLPTPAEINLKELRQESTETPSCIKLEELSLQKNGSFEYFKFEYVQTCGNDINSHLNILAYCSKN